MEYRYDDIKIGDIFNNLQVVDLYEKAFDYPSRTRHEKMAVVKCLKCGSEELIETKLKQLLKGHTGMCKHCRDNAGRRKGNPQNHNKYVFTQNFVIGYTNKGEEFYFDLEDYDLIKKYTWRINAQGYVQTQQNKKKILMHRLIMNPSEEEVIDHKNRLRNYNLKNNLNIVSKKENSQNRSKHKNNTSGFNGVSFDRNANAWRAYISIDGKRIYGGLFDDINDAIQKRLDLEKEHYQYLQSIKDV